VAARLAGNLHRCETFYPVDALECRVVASHGHIEWASGLLGLSSAIPQAPAESRARRCRLVERELFIGTQLSILYTSMYSPAEAATPRA